MSATMVDAPGDVQLWSRVIAPDRGDMPADVAEFFLKLEFGPEDRARMHDLAVRHQAGSLSSTEEADLAAYRRVGLQLDILRAKARLSLRAAS